MTIASDYQAMYRRQMDERGETITVKRGATTKDVLAIVRGFKPEELAGGIVQSDQRVIILEEDLAAAPAFPALASGSRLQVGDQLIVRGRTRRMGAVDDSTRRIGATLIAYDIVATG